ncbi:hypothetical protein SAMN04489867_2117 [Pedococcus dokdonensis]|uniref:Uncharacterized protein n=1 Tax=Pedococcus dokdonensis TaxID=443156 RepID=A0A1H0RWT7_9MICO|nr:hypothetical protein [Pedococcus dokdonensis]SDP33903.1 hypothetical protein SAMN04489867_2117 [Pedococcus dokdonensis]
MDIRTLLIRCAALLTVGAALIHVGVSADHFQEWWAAGLFFLVSAAAQLGWAVWCWSRPVSRRVLLAGAGGSVALALVWVVSRSSGLPIGPEAGVAEPVGVADTVCVALEVLSAALAVVAATAWAPSRLRSPSTPHRAAAITGAVAALTLVASGAAIAAPGHGHATDEASASTTHSHGDATTDEGDDAEGAVHAHDHGDIPNLPDTSRATPEQTAAAKDLLAKTIAATAAYRDPAAATKAGFDVQAAWDRKQKKLAALGKEARDKGQVHVPKKANRADGRILDPNAPETLIYRRSAEGKFTLVGVMFTAEKKAPPTSYQPYVRWHTHEACTGGGVKKLKPVDGKCASGTTLRTSGAMTHLWFVDQSQLAQAYAVKPPVKAMVAYQKALS